jgi:serine phosphatase RsbU (regulator of sigma subunit)
MPETAPPSNIPYWFVILILALLGFFLVRFWFLVDEIRKDVKKVLIDEAARNQLVRSLKEDVDEFKIKQQAYEKKLNYLERELQRKK